MLYKFVVIIALGAPAVGVLLFEVLLNGTAMFNHANVKLPLGLDRVLRMLIVTPDKDLGQCVSGDRVVHGRAQEQNLSTNLFNKFAEILRERHWQLLRRC